MAAFFRLPVLGLMGLAVLLAACSTSPRGPAAPNPHYKIGSPYKVKGRWYTPRADPYYDEVGTASWYGRQFHGRLTANGEVFDMNRMTAAHTTLPLPSIVEVENLRNGRRVRVRVNDRGPFAHGRIIDLSREAARRLGFEGEGLTQVRVRYVSAASLPSRARMAQASPPKPAAQTPSGPAARPERDEIADIIQDLSIEVMSTEAPLESGAQPPFLGMAKIEPIDPVEIAGSPAELFIIRVIALSKVADASAMTDALAKLGSLRLTRVTPEESAALYQIHIGPFASREIASERLETAREAGYGDAALVTLRP
ncbi:MAG: septal ring lytic transglycosylase RlpA family protein [Pseudomonadota bacterium]